MSDNTRHTGDRMKIETLRKLANREEVDYQYLLSILSAYSRPRDKISAWLKSNDLIRIKKGLYVFSKESAINPYSSEVLANLIYGPSAVSLNYALAYYGLIPERIETITNITNKRNKAFSTPVGDFTYRYLSSEKYSVGIEIANYGKSNQFLIASPEKALCDHIHLTDKKIEIASIKEMETYLLHDLRIDETTIRSLRITKLSEIEKTYKDNRFKLLIELIKKWK